MTHSQAAPQPLCDLFPADALARLEAEAAEDGRADDSAATAALPPTAIEVVESLFQPRAIAEHHLSVIVAAVKAGRTIEPLLVYRVGARVVLLDGHHRLEAYRRARVTIPIPVKFFKGTLQEAVLAARKANSTPKLAMSPAERANDAWRLVKLGKDKFSKPQICDAANVSDSLVAAMRRALKALGAEAANDCETWREARQQAEGKEGYTDMTESEREARLAMIAEDWARRIGKAVGSKMANNSELAAMALERYFGRRLPDVFHHLKGYVSEAGADAPADEDCDF
jgi:hypothetical protein